MVCYPPVATGVRRSIAPASLSIVMSALPRKGATGFAYRPRLGPAHWHVLLLPSICQAGFADAGLAEADAPVPSGDLLRAAVRIRTVRPDGVVTMFTTVRHPGQAERRDSGTSRKFFGLAAHNLGRKSLIDH